MLPSASYIPCNTGEDGNGKTWPGASRKHGNPARKEFKPCCDSVEAS